MIESVYIAKKNIVCKEENALCRHVKASLGWGFGGPAWKFGSESLGNSIAKR